MRKMYKRLGSMIMAMVMLFTLIPANALAAQEDGMTLRVSSVTAAPGATVDVKLEFENNPGISSMKVKVAFDTVLTLQNVAFNPGMGGQSQLPQTMNSPVTLNWVNGSANFTEKAATFATLTFLVADDADDNTVANITVTYNQADVYNLAEEDIPLNVIDGNVKVLSCIPGDINGDEAVNNKDLSRLFQYLADWDVWVNEAALDVNGDGSVNNKDFSRLFQYLAEWNVEIFAGTVSSKKCDHVMEKTEYKANTCTEDGNTAYWHCTVCDKYFTNETGNTEISYESTILPATGHEIVIDSSVAPTETHTGLTEGSHCAVSRGRSIGYPGQY